MNATYAPPALPRSHIFYRRRLRGSRCVEGPVIHRLSKDVMVTKNENLNLKRNVDVSVEAIRGDFLWNSCIDKCKILFAWSAAKEFSLARKEP